MFKALSEFFETWKQLQAFQASPEAQRNLVVYSEGSQDWPHIGPMLQTFLEQHPERHLSFLSSGRNDPGLAFGHPRFHAYYLGAGTNRTIFFKSLKARVCLMTLPDLDVYELKRSLHPVHYVYAFHSISSTHTVYRERAFERFDTLFCVGPHHRSELRKEEEIKGLKPRRLLEHGSVKLDTIVAQYSQAPRPSPAETPYVLLAPSWGECSFAEDPELIRSMIRQILARGWTCRLRFHPMTLRHHPALAEGLEKDFAGHAGFSMESNLNDNESLKRAHLMVSDWSGAATEFAFALGKPVLFIDTPQKLNNPKWQAFGNAGLESELRTQLGAVLKPTEVAGFADLAQRLISESAAYQQSIQAARERWIFNVNGAAARGATLLEGIIKEFSV